MTAEQYIDSLSEKDQNIISCFRHIILKNDQSVSEKFGKLMKNPNTFCYYEQDVFKYGLTVSKNHFSFHSLVLYSNPELMEELTTELQKVKFQKGCINFKNLDNFPIPNFEKHIKASAAIDFSPVIQHYQNKK
ncbi:DUF1801 domain-containing protein [Myroides indicus]|uniref:Uncharacterized protein n=1 Tax=Myroides indicus TaxID=1323422 RepID=A0A4R7ES71_9FLAO|nr:DUF1801 domain-containing protein [Myroides indicus]TDS54580.1 hypothetical protein C8P70_12523 [Myroides indicus]